MGHRIVIQNLNRSVYRSFVRILGTVYNAATTHQLKENFTNFSLHRVGSEGGGSKIRYLRLEPNKSSKVFVYERAIRRRKFVNINNVRKSKVCS